jgi:hypothetical protein
VWLEILTLERKKVGDREDHSPALCEWHFGLEELDCRAGFGS